MNPEPLRSLAELDPEPAMQECRGCGASFPYDPDADFCPGCAAENRDDA